MALRCNPVSNVVQDILDSQDAVIQEAQLAFAANPRRHGMYFPANFDALGEAERLEGDDITEELSTWEFSAAISIMPPKPPRVLKSGLTPSQEIASRFRKGLSLDLGSSSSLSLASLEVSPVSGQSSLDGYATAEEEFADDWCLPPRPVLDPKVKFRQSRVDALPLYLEEAEAELRRSQHDEDVRIVCPRDGCRDTLSNVSALAYHLHLHDVDADRQNASHRCKDCDACFQTRSQLAIHACPCRSKSAPTSPIFGALLHSPRVIPQKLIEFFDLDSDFS
ncbi:hypothetical protein VKT23_004829 [Stygiomarasmius scandens]|uniref:C2H2-type domain-containing protein n=1 Tax=Marasmiellus scandens TaxID=2682957 RepID=A0ABR1JSX0_9AGAR